MVQGNSDSLQKFGVDIDRLVRHAYHRALEAFECQISVSSSIHRVNDLELQQAIRLSIYKELQETVTLAI